MREGNGGEMCESGLDRVSSEKYLPLKWNHTSSTNFIRSDSDLETDLLSHRSTTDNGLIQLQNFDNSCDGPAIAPHTNPQYLYEHQEEVTTENCAHAQEDRK